MKKANDKKYSVKYLALNTCPWQRRASYWYCVLDGRKKGTYSTVEEAETAMEELNRRYLEKSFDKVLKVRIMDGKTAVKEYNW